MYGGLRIIDELLLQGVLIGLWLFSVIVSGLRGWGLQRR